MATFEVRLINPAATLNDGMNAFLVVAENTTDALAIVQAERTGDSGYDSATITGVGVGGAISVNGTLLGWRCIITITGSGVDKFEFEFGAGADINDIGTTMASTINSLSPNIANASYDAATNILTVAGTLDNMGNQTVTCRFFSPRAFVGNTQITQDVVIPGFVVAIVHQGAVGAALTIQFPADTYVKPQVLWGYARP